MDEFYLEPLYPTPYLGPLVQTPDVLGCLRRLDDNAAAMRAGCFDPILTRRLLLQYLGICELIPFASSHIYMEEARNTLISHSLSIPAGTSLADDADWSELIKTRTAALGAGSDGLTRCAHGSHCPDHLWYYYSTGGTPNNSVLVIDYFGRNEKKAVDSGRTGMVRDVYERCACGLWHRPAAVF